MKKRIITLLLALVLAIPALSLAADIDFDAMTLEEVQALADEANAYYREMTRLDGNTKKAVESYLEETLVSMFDATKISDSLLGYTVIRERDQYTVEGKAKITTGSGKETYEIRAVINYGDQPEMLELYVDGILTDGKTAPATPEPVATKAITASPKAETPKPMKEPKENAAYGEQLSLIETGDICVLKYKIETQSTSKLTINQNYYTIVSFIMDGGGDQYSEIQYWAVADMRDGTESKVISFTVPGKVIQSIADGRITANKLGDYVEELWILPSLSK